MPKKSSDPKPKEKKAAKGTKPKTAKATVSPAEVPAAVLPPLPVIVPATKTEPAPAATEKPAPKAKAAKPKAAAKPRTAPKKKPAPVEMVISNDDIALRAYYIAERRQRLGWPGDSTSDWIEAERQLRAEALKKG
ncbi:MAG: DUF2934 domain-containing protein [Terrimicrobiaceae bacterium]|nr:DUF2934 domain-containing protein [Terrimicrobiaceae bacterium]